MQSRLATAYDSVDDVDLWVGALAEDPRPGAHVGQTNFRIIRDQFIALRDGDRMWWERTLGPDDRQRIQNTRLSDIVRRNTTIGAELPDDVFTVPEGVPPVGCDSRLGSDSIPAATTTLSLVLFALAAPHLRRTRQKH